MKTQTFALAIAACMSSGLFSATVYAQPSRADAEVKRQQITETLGLSDTQAAEMQAIHVAAQEKRQALKEQGRQGGDREAVRTEMEALRADMDAQVQSILTPEQYNTLQELRPERRARGGRGQGGRGEGAGPGEGGGHGARGDRGPRGQ
jgi:Spy/CpxP family protein refolding chaperone